MARILIHTFPWGGHINALAGVAWHLVRRSHRVQWVCLSDATGGPAWTPPAIEIPGVEVLDPIPLEARTDPSGLTTPDIFRNLSAHADLVAHHVRCVLPKEVDELRRRMRAFQPDVLVLDGHVMTGVIGAELEELPYVQVFSGLHLFAPEDLECDQLRLSRACLPAILEVYRRFDLRPNLRCVESVVSPWLNIVFTTREIIGADTELPPRTHLVGPFRPIDACAKSRLASSGFPFARLRDDRPLIYAAFGTLITGDSILIERLARASKALGAQLVVATGGSCAHAFGAAADDPIVVSYAPQMELLSRASVFVTHGGSNSVTEALISGVPMLVLAKYGDGPLQAWFLERAGVCRGLDPDRVNTAMLQEALGALLARDAKERLRARTIAAAWASVDGSEEAVERIIRLVEQPVREPPSIMR